MENNAQQSDDFGAFLESVQRAVKPDEVSNTGSTANMKIMNMLAKIGEVDMAQLVAMVELPWSDFTSGIDSLKSAGLVVVNETTQGAKVQLTSDGQRWVSALNSPNQ